MTIEFALPVTTLTIIDNSKGVELSETISEFAKVGRLGRIGMQGHVWLLNGTFTVFSKPGTGTALSTKIVE